MARRNSELADFLRRARSACDASRSGLPADERVRRVPGLRREEVALLAGVSTDYYAKLEQGRPIVPSGAVVDAIGRALDLDDAGRAHLADLIGARSPAGGPVPRRAQRARPGLHQLLAGLEGQPAMVLGRRGDVLAQNRLAKELFVDFEQWPAPRRNYTRWMLLAPEPRSLFLDWETQARTAVESLRLEAGSHPDRATDDLVEELRAASEQFDTWWHEHRVYRRTHGSKQLRHPVVGDLTVQFETLVPPGDPDTTVFVYTTEPASPSRRAMDMLASWTLPHARPRTGG